VNHNRERDAISEDVDTAITVGVFLASFLIGCAALALYLKGFTVSGISLGVVALIGANIPSVGYAWWRKRRTSKTSPE